MAIVSSVTVSSLVQRDGRKWVQERHVDQLGLEYFRHWLALADDDLAAALAAYALVLNEIIRLAEIDRNITNVKTDGSLAVVTFSYSTAAENRSALRDAYRDATRVEAIMIGDFLSSLTNAQLQTVFNMTNTQVNTLRTNKLTPAASAAATIRATTGA